MSSISFSNVTSTHNHISHTTNTWIIDTGATDYMICSSKFFTHNVTLIRQTIKLPNGAFGTASHIGDVHLSTDLILHNALCVPGFSFNPLSAKSLAHHSNCCLIFLSNSCYIQPLSSWMMIGVRMVRDGLYHLQLTRPNLNSLNSFSHTPLP